MMLEEGWELFLFRSYYYPLFLKGVCVRFCIFISSTCFTTTRAHFNTSFVDFWVTRSISLFLKPKQRSKTGLAGERECERMCGAWGWGGGFQKTAKLTTPEESGVQGWESVC